MRRSDEVDGARCRKTEIQSESRGVEVVLALKWQAYEPLAVNWIWRLVSMKWIAIRAAVSLADARMGNEIGGDHAGIPK